MAIRILYLTGQDDLPIHNVTRLQPFIDKIFSYFVDIVYTQDKAGWISFFLGQLQPGSLGHLVLCYPFHGNAVWLSQPPSVPG